jgi:hypothetical protein
LALVTNRILPPIQAAALETAVGHQSAHQVHRWGVVDNNTLQDVADNLASKSVRNTPYHTL